MTTHKQSVENFLQELSSKDAHIFHIVQSVRSLVQKKFPKVKERIMYGGIMFSLSEDFGGIFPYAKHASFEFSNGKDLDDPESILEGSGKHRRHIKLASTEDINDKKLDAFLDQLG